MNRICKFTPHRPNRAPCDRESMEGYSFCKRHSNTLQAQNYSPSTQEKEEESGYKKVEIVQNKFGNFEDVDSGIVFNKKTRKAQGYQNHADGKVYPLSPSHIVVCKKNYWDYVEPRQPPSLKEREKQIEEEERQIKIAKQNHEKQEKMMCQHQY